MLKRKKQLNGYVENLEFYGLQNIPWKIEIMEWNIETMEWNIWKKIYGKDKSCLV